MGKGFFAVQLLLYLKTLAQTYPNAEGDARERLLPILVPS